MAYQPKLPEGSRIHQAFHVSLLKKKLGDANSTTTELSPFSDDGKMLVQPEAILDTYWIKGSNFVEESLVKWKQLPHEDATWRALRSYGSSS